MLSFVALNIYKSIKTKIRKYVECIFFLPIHKENYWDVKSRKKKKKKRRICILNCRDVKVRCLIKKGAVMTIKIRTRFVYQCWPNSLPTVSRKTRWPFLQDVLWRCIFPVSLYIYILIYAQVFYCDIYIGIKSIKWFTKNFWDWDFNEFIDDSFSTILNINNNSKSGHIQMSVNNGKLIK